MKRSQLGEATKLAELLDVRDQMIWKMENDMPHNGYVRISGLEYTVSTETACKLHNLLKKEVQLERNVIANRLVQLGVEAD